LREIIVEKVKIQEILKNRKTYCKKLEGDIEKLENSDVAKLFNNK
jgi:hypothetical protein